MATVEIEESYLGILRRTVEDQYREHPTGCGGSFGELLCWEMHTNHKTFLALADKWGISVVILGELIWDHCKRLQPMPMVNFDLDT